MASRPQEGRHHSSLIAGVGTTSTSKRRLFLRDEPALLRWRGVTTTRGIRAGTPSRVGRSRSGGAGGEPDGGEPARR